MSKIIGLGIVSIFILLTVLCSVNNRNDSYDGKEIVLRLEPGPDNPRNSEGDFIQLKNGDILFIYTHFTEGAGDHAGAYLAGRISSDDGKTWTSEDMTILPNEGDMNVMSVSLLRLTDGRIALFYLRKNSEADCIPYMRTSTDEAKTWSEPIKCIDDPGYFVMNNDRVVQLRSGRILLPVSLHDFSGPSPGVGRVMCYYSDDGGSTWAKSAEAPNPDHIVLQEPGVVELKNGDLMMFIRTDANVQYFSFSKDGGEHWTQVEPGNIRSPLSPASIERIPATGDLLLVWNNNTQKGRDGGKRTPFNAAISTDEGKTWEKMKTLESNPDGWYCYTAIEFVGDHVLLGHCAGDRKKNNGLATTQITRLSNEWLYREATPAPFVRSDKNGVLQLACPIPEAKIYYTLDGRAPDESAPVYREPIKLQKPALLRMQARQTGLPPSKMISQNVGLDIFQEAQAIHSPLKTGLRYQYFEGLIGKTADINSLSLVDAGVMPRISIEPFQKAQEFACIFSGFIKIPQDGVYTFYLLSNDGSVLYLNDEKFIDNDGGHGDLEVSRAVSLRSGMHKIEIKYFQMGGGKSLAFFWSGPDFVKSAIPETLLFHSE